MTVPRLTPGLLRTPIVDTRTGMVTENWQRYLVGDPTLATAIMQLQETVATLQALVALLEGQPYLVTSASSLLTQERVLAGEELVLTVADGGPNSVAMVAVLAQGIGTAKLADLAVTTAKLDELAVTTAKLAALSVTTAKLADLAVTTGKFNDLAVTTGKLADLAVTTAKLNDLAATTAKINDLAISTGKLADLAVTTGKLALNAVTDTILRDSAAVSVLGRSANSVGDPADIVASANDQALMRQGDALAFAVPTAGTHSLWIPADAMRPAVTAGATADVLEMATNDNTYGVLAFADTGTPEYAVFQLAMPAKWNKGTLTYQVVWTLNSTSTNSAVFGLQAVAMSNGDSLDVAFGTAVEVTDAGLGTAYLSHVSPLSSALTVGGSPANSDLTTFRVYRDSGDGSDTLAGVTAYLLGVQLFWVTSATTDA